MKQVSYHYIDTLNEVLSQRQRQNPHYSLRSFARDLGIHPSTLSLVLKKKRPLPKKDLNATIKALRLSPIQDTLFRESFHKVKARLDDIAISAEIQERTFLDETYYNVIAEWEYYTFLSWVELEGQEHSTQSIARGLGITPQRAQVVVNELTRIGFLSLEEGRYVAKVGKLRTSEDIASQALRKSHHETLDLAKKKLEEIRVDLRDFSTVTIALDPEKLPEAKTIIREFRHKMEELLRGGKKEEVYQLAIQFFPMTNNQEQREQVQVQGEKHESVH